MSWWIKPLAKRVIFGELALCEAQWGLAYIQNGELAIAKVNKASLTYKTVNWPYKLEGQWGLAASTKYKTVKLANVKVNGASLTYKTVDCKLEGQWGLAYIQNSGLAVAKLNEAPFTYNSVNTGHGRLFNHHLLSSSPQNPHHHSSNHHHRIR